MSELPTKKPLRLVDALEQLLKERTRSVMIPPGLMASEVPASFPLAHPPALKTLSEPNRYRLMPSTPLGTEAEVYKSDKVSIHQRLSLMLPRTDSWSRTNGCPPLAFSTQLY